MATFRSGEILARLQPLGWIVEPMKEFVCGDPRIIDPTDGTIYSLYQAEKIQDKREGKEVKDDEANR